MILWVIGFLCGIAITVLLGAAAFFLIKSECGYDDTYKDDNWNDYEG